MRESVLNFLQGVTRIKNPFSEGCGGMSGTVDSSRRKWLLVATSAAGGVAAAGATAPFVLSLQPSERAKAAGAPIEVDVGSIEPGAVRVVEWQGKPVWVFRRTPEQIASLERHESELSDPGNSLAQQPDYCKNRNRSIKPEFLVVIGVCTHLGCSPVYRPTGASPDLGTQWPGGWFCPCHGSRFDLAARVFKGSPAPTNLIVPPHQYLSDKQLLIGDDKKTGVA